MIADLTTLTAFDTQNPPGREAPCAEFIAAQLEAVGFTVTLDRFEAHGLPDRVNVAARLENGPGPVFAFNTHMDVVPVGEGWSRPPLTLAEADGKLFARGACDAKGPLAAMLEALRLLAAQREAWSGTLLGVFVADEEVGSAGARRLAEQAPKIDLAIIGEPTSNRTIIAHKGSLRPIVRVKGTAAHSASPQLGVNAIFQTARLLPRIEALGEEIAARPPHPLVGGGSLTVTRANAGLADNMVPDQMELMLDRRMIPGEDEASATAEIEALLVAAREELGVEAEIVRFAPTTGGAAETLPDHPLVAAGRAAGRRHGAGEDDAPLGFSGACDLVHFRTLGAQGIVIGPGSIGVAHKPDEFVPIDEFEASARIYADVVLEMMPRA
ncbi:M20 family metallopeptidase [Acuticoccus mangrovi]|nr:M20 family metallopeptidase [Acuticoccus mangrovi]